MFFIQKNHRFRSSNSTSIRIYVGDIGVGIAKDNQQRAFEQFEKLKKQV